MGQLRHLLLPPTETTWKRRTFWSWSLSSVLSVCLSFFVANGPSYSLPMEATAVSSKTFPILPAELFSDFKRKEVGVLFPILQVCKGSTNCSWSTLAHSSLTPFEVDRVLATVKSAWQAMVNCWHHQTLAFFAPGSTALPFQLVCPDAHSRRLNPVAPKSLL